MSGLLAGELSGGLTFRVTLYLGGSPKLLAQINQLKAVGRGARPHTKGSDRGQRPISNPDQLSGHQRQLCGGSPQPNWSALSPVELIQSECVDAADVRPISPVFVTRLSTRVDP